MADEATYDGRQHIERWLSAKQELERAKAKVNSCECEVSNAQTELAKWMIPADAKAGEKICVWQGKTLYQVEVADHGRDHIVTARPRGAKP